MTKLVNASDELNKSYDKSNFDGVLKYIGDEFINEDRTVSLKSLHIIYGLGIRDRRYKYHLKERLIAKFGEKLMLRSPLNNNTSEIFVSSSCIDDIINVNNEVILKRAAKLLVDDTVEKFKETPLHPWPPTAGELSKDVWKPPTLHLSQLYSEMLKSCHKSRKDCLILLQRI